MVKRDICTSLITLDIHFSAVSRTALFRLKAPLGIKAFANKKTPLFLYISGDRISSLVQDVLDAAPEVVREKLGAVPSRLQLSLSSPADMLLAQETSLSVYLAPPSLSEAFLQPLCNAVASRTLKPIDSAAALRSLYRGLGGKILEGAPLKTEADVMATCKKMVDNMMAQFRQEERAYYSSQLQQVRASYSEDLQTIKTEIMEYVDKRLSDLEDTLHSEEDVDNQISQHVASFDDLVDVKIEDRVTGIRIELEEFVEGEVIAAEERVLQRVRDANWTFSIEEYN
ncbi:hypothetical protein F4803DRAFT_558975 [Xylaria telfairii]|nr:hypothetical protein F4803DRAFT_558975 [Xylaria telfairii]